MKKNIKIKLFKGFTLIELLAVIVILAIIIVIAVPQITKVIKNSEISTCKNNLKIILKSLNDKKSLNPDLDITSINISNASEILQISDKDYKFIEFYTLNDKTNATVIYDDKCNGYVTYGSEENVSVEPIDDYFGTVDVTNENNTQYNSSPALVAEPDGCIPVTNATEFNNIRNNLSASYCLKNDIDLSSISNWVPIGSDSSRFVGQIVGNNHYIFGLNASATGSSISLFGFAENAKFYNIKFKNMNMSSDNSSSILVYTLYGTTSEIKNIHVESSNKISAGECDTASPSGCYASALVSVLYGSLTIDNTYSNMSYTSGYNIGGFIGTIPFYFPQPTLTISNSKSIIKTNKNTFTNVGGFAYETSLCTINIQNSSVESNIKITGSNPSSYLRVGGFIGYLQNATLNIDDSWTVNNMNVENGYAAGMIAEEFFSTTNITDSYVKNSDISTPCTKAGISCKASATVGEASGGSSNPFTMNNSYVRNTRASGNYASSVAGYISTPMTLNNISFVNTDINGTEYAGNITGQISGSGTFYLDTLFINNSRVFVQGTNDFSAAGGVIGDTTFTGTLNIENLSVNATVEMEHSEKPSGLLIGQSNSPYIVENANLKGNVIGGVAGGIVGFSKRTSSIIDTTFNGNITANAYAGGAIAHSTSAQTINNFDFIGTINSSPSSAAVGGILGASFAGLTVSNSSVDATFNAYGFVGGLAGQSVAPSTFGSTTIKGTINNNSTEDPMSTGGIFGYVGANVTISSLVESSVTMNSIDYVGGFAGIKAGASFTGENNMRFTGTINSTGSNVSTTYGA